MKILQKFAILVGVKSTLSDESLDILLFVKLFKSAEIPIKNIR